MATSSPALKPKLEKEDIPEKIYERKDVVYHIQGVETCFIDPQGSGSSSLVTLSQDDDLFVILCPPEGIDDPASEGLPAEILYLKAGRISCPLSPNQPTMRKNHQEVRLAYLFPMEIVVDEESKFIVFAVILPATLESKSPIVLGFEDLLHKFTLFSIEEVERPPQITDADVPALPKNVDMDEKTEWDIVYTLSPVHCCVIDLEAADEEDDVDAEDDSSYDMGKSRLNVLLFPPKELVAVQVATKSILLHSELVVKRKYYEDDRLVYFFPFFERADEEDDEDSEMVLTVVLPIELTENTPEVIGFEDLLHKFANLVIEEMEIVEPAEEDENRPPDTFDKPELAIKIERQGYKVRTAIVKSAVHMGRGIFWTSNYINKHVRPNQKPTKVSRKTMARIYNARVVSGKVFGASVKTLNMWNIGYKKVGGMTVALWAKSPLYKKITEGATTKNQAAVRDLFGAGSEAVMGIYYGLKDAGRILGECSKAATVNVIRHKWGDEAGYAAQESLNVVRDLSLAGWYAYNALTPSWQQILREGSYELFDQLANFRNWTSARILRTGTIYFKIPLLISSNYSVRFLVMTEEALLVFYDKEHFMRSMSVAFPDRTEILEAALKGDVVIRDWRPGMKIPGVVNPDKKKRKKRKKKKNGEEEGEQETEETEGETETEETEGETEGEKEEEEEEEEGKTGENANSEESNNHSESSENGIKKSVTPLVWTASAVEVDPTTHVVDSNENAADNSIATPEDDEYFGMPELEPAPPPNRGLYATPLPPPDKKALRKDSTEVKELSSVDKESFKRTGFAGIKDMKMAKKVKTKNFYRKAYMFVAAMPLEEMDYARYEDEQTDIIQRHSRPYCFTIQTRDGTWTHYSTDSYVESTDWVEELSRRIVWAKERRANKYAEELPVDSPNLPKFSDHDYTSWLPKELPKPASLPAAHEVNLLPKKMLSSTELPRDIHDGKDFNLL